MESVDGLVRGIIVRFRLREIKCFYFFEHFGDSDDSVCVVRRSLAT